MHPRFFKSPPEFRNWLEQNHARAKALWVGFHKRDSGKASLTWPQAVDQALCFGWIDGVRKSIDESSYTIRFTPRKPKSIWSTVNIKRVGELARLGLMQPAGVKAFEERDQKKTKLYSYEAGLQKLDPARERKFRVNKQAWVFFQSQAPSYQKMAVRWVESAKQPETQARRLAILIKDSKQGKRLAMTTKWSKTKSIVRGKIWRRNKQLTQTEMRTYEDETMFARRNRPSCFSMQFRALSSRS